MSEILVILNPFARSTKAGDAMARIQSLPGPADVALATEPNETRLLAATAAQRGYRTVVAAGGDGTINAVVNGLVGTGTTLGVLPVGTMNVFAAELGLPSNLEYAWKVILSGDVREIDLAVANEHYFVQLAGVGLDAQIVKETSWDMKRNWGPLSYVVSMAQVAARKPPQLLVDYDGQSVEGSFVLVGNGRYYGGPLAFFKQARVDDGRLDALVFQKMSYIDIARYLGNVLVGSHVDLPDCHYFQAKEIRVTCTDCENVPVETDGDLVTEVPVTFRLSSRKLRVHVPAEGQ